MTQVLKPLKQEHEYIGSHVIVRRHELDRVRTIDYPIDDLVNTSQESDQLVQLIQRGVSPDDWPETSNPEASVEVVGNKLKVTQSQQVHYRLLVFLERLRMVRALSTRSRFPVGKLAPSPLHGAMSQRLAGPATFTFTHETPLAEIFSHWQRELDVPLLVDWVAIADEDLSVDSPVICTMCNASWQEALTAVLEPLGLDWRVGFGGSIEISSAARFAEDLQLELYRLPEGSDFQLAELAQDLPQVATSPHATVEFDSQRQAIIALQPARLQREISAWLVKRGAR